MRLSNVATPLTSGFESVPPSVAPDGLLPKSIETLPVAPVAVLPQASLARTVTAGVIGEFFSVSVGCWTNASDATVPPPPAVTVRTGSLPARWKSLPGGPLKLFACLARDVHVALVALHAVATVTCVETLPPGAIASAFEAARNSITPDTGVVVHALPVGAAAAPTAVTLKPEPVGTVTLADPRLCVLAELFRSVST